MNEQDIDAMTDEEFDEFLTQLIAIPRRKSMAGKPKKSAPKPMKPKKGC